MQMDEATNSQDLDLNAPEFDPPVPELDEFEALESIDFEAVAAEQTADLELDMLELEPSLSAAEGGPEPSEPVAVAASADVPESEPEAAPVEQPAAQAAADEPSSAPETKTASPEKPESAEGAAKERERISHIVFRIDDQRYAVEMQRLLELDRMTPVTPVPHTPEFILGVTNLRGEIVSVIDFRRLLGMQTMERPETGRLLKLRDRRQLLVSGVLVDAIQGARTIKPEDIRPVRTNVGPKIAPLLQGVCDDAGEEVNVLDVDKLFESEQVRALTGA